MNPDYKNMSADRIAEKQRQDYEAEQHDNGCAVTIMLFMIAGMLGAEFPVVWLGVFVILAILSIRSICRWIKNQ